jgi:hypothetical protein
MLDRPTPNAHSFRVFIETPLHRFDQVLMLASIGSLDKPLHYHPRKNHQGNHSHAGLFTHPGQKLPRRWGAIDVRFAPLNGHGVRCPSTSVWCHNQTSVGPLVHGIDIVA